MPSQPPASGTSTDGITVSGGHAQEERAAEPPFWSATRAARVPVVAAPERVICVALATSKLALMHVERMLAALSYESGLSVGAHALE
jgi:hypothetical protein